MTELDVTEANDIPKQPGCRVRFFLQSYTHLYEIECGSLVECILQLYRIEQINGGHHAYWRRYFKDGAVVSIPREEEDAVTANAPEINEDGEYVR